MMCNVSCVPADARGGLVHGAGEDHGGLPHAGDVQAIDGRARAVHVPARSVGAGTHPRLVRTLSVTIDSY